MPETERVEGTIAPNEQSTQPDKLVSIKTIMEAADISDRTVKRLATEHDWDVKKFNSRLIRYRKSEVEETLGINL